jgi:peptidoglycan/xylan/chitin deacetylase (PgdA/CDA1 family)
MEKLAFFSMDVEEWYDADCFAGKTIKNGVSSMEGLDHFIDLLDKYQIKGTFFVVVSRLQEAKPYLKKAVQNGHEIAIHGWDHRVVTAQDPTAFKEDLLKAKALIKKELGVEPVGYRAPCFALDEAHYRVLKEVGLAYDCSTLPLKHHPHYVTHTLGNRTENSNIYCDGFFRNFVLNEGRYFLFSFPFSGGAYSRTPEWSSYKTALSHHLSKENTYIFYVHPFELTAKKLQPFPTKNPGLRLYFSRGRKGYLRRVEGIIRLLKKKGYKSCTFQAYCQHPAQ